jgi:hypothetical protein
MRFMRVGLVLSVVALAASSSVGLSQTASKVSKFANCEDFPQLCRCRTKSKIPSATKERQIKIIKIFRKAGKATVRLSSCGITVDADCDDFPELCAGSD